MTLTESMDNREGKTILIAGGTGLIGVELRKQLEQKGHIVRVFTRQQNPSPPFFHWDPYNKIADHKALVDVEVMINLSGVPVVGKRWTEKRRQAIIDSRVDTNLFLHELSAKAPSLTQFISASGITCYGFEDPVKEYSEEDPYGTDFLSEVVKKWEASADTFSPQCKVAKIRTGVVLTEKGGALPIISKTIRYYVGSPMGRGGQIMPWITLKDIARIYVHVIEHQLDGAFNATSADISNAQLVNALAKKLHKPLWLPKVPSALIKLAMGEMSSAVLKGVHIDRSKILATGFEFKHKTIDDALIFIYVKNEAD